MARINIDDSLLLSPEFRVLERKIGRRCAIGTFYDLFKLAQLYWCRFEKETKMCSRSGIPKTIYEMEDFPDELIHIGLIDELEDCFMLKNSSEHFDWLVQKTEAGSKGGRPNKNNDITKAARKRLGAESKDSFDAVNPPYSLLLTPSSLIQTNKVLTNTIAQNAAPKVAESELLEIYNLYPRKVGKANGLKILRRIAKTPEDVGNVMSAVQKYVEQCRVNETEPKYIKHFSTFMGSWRDWLDDDVGKSEDFSSGKKSAWEAEPINWDEFEKRHGGKK